MSRSKEFNGYLVTDKGKVFSKETNWRGYGLREMSQQETHGYKVVRLTIDGKRKKFRVHRLVAQSFLPKPKGKDLVCHKDGNKENNKVENLYWGDDRDNALDRQNHGNCFITNNASSMAKKQWRLKNETK